MIKIGLESVINNEMNKAVFYSDTHFDKESEKSLNILYEYIDKNKRKIKYICDCGDGIDNPHMSTFPVHPDEMLSSQEQFDMYANHLKTLSYISPDSSKYLMSGNHDKARLNNAKTLNRGLGSLRCLEYESVLKEAMSNAGIDDIKYFLCDKAQDIPLTPSNIITIMHGDPRLNPLIKGGVTGIRRTGESYPNCNTLIMGHGHWYQHMPRLHNGKSTIMLGCMADIEKMKLAYVNQHPYSNGFGIMHYNKRQDKAFWEYKEIK